IEIFAMENLDAGNPFCAPSEARDPKADPGEQLCGVASEHAEAENTDGDFARCSLCVLVPEFFALLRLIEQQPAMMQQHVQRHVLGHARGEIPVDDTHNGYARQVRVADEMIDAGTERENYLEIWELREQARRRFPSARIGDRAKIADAIGPNADFAARGERRK